MLSQSTGVEGKNPGPSDESSLVSAIIVTWNKEEDVIRLLETLENIDYPEEKLEVTVVDNNSTDNTVEAIESAYPQVRLIRNEENLGGAGGFNKGMRWVLTDRPESRYMWLLDNDVLVDTNALKELVSVMERNPDVGMCGSRVMNISDRKEVLEVGAFIDYRLGKSIGNLPKQSQFKDTNALFEVDYVAACSLLVRTELVRKVGLLNDDLFIYWDDKEWGARFKARGHKVVACSASVVYHPDWKVRRFADNSFIWRYYYGTRNCLWFFNNYMSGIRRRLLLLRIVFNSMAFAAGSCVSGRSTFSQVTIRGTEDFFRGSYGRKAFQMPTNDIEQYLTNRPTKHICVFVPEGPGAHSAKSFVLDLMRKYPDMKVLAIVPDEVRHMWANLLRENNIKTYRRLKKGTIPFLNKLRIAKFLWTKPWNILFVPPVFFGIPGVRGRDVAVVDFSRGVILSVEQTTLNDFLHICVKALYFLIRSIIFPPDTEYPIIRGSR